MHQRPASPWRWRGDVYQIIISPHRMRKRCGYKKLRCKGAQQLSKIATTQLPRTSIMQLAPSLAIVAALTVAAHAAAVATPLIINTPYVALLRYSRYTLGLIALSAPRRVSASRLSSLGPEELVSQRTSNLCPNPQLMRGTRSAFHSGRTLRSAPACMLTSALRFLLVAVRHTS